MDFLADTLQNGRIGASYNGRIYVSREDGTVTVDSNTQVISMSGNTIVYQGNVAVTSDSAANKTTIDFQDLGVTIVHQFGQDPFFQVILRVTVVYFKHVSPTPLPTVDENCMCAITQVNISDTNCVHPIFRLLYSRAVNWR